MPPCSKLPTDRKFSNTRTRNDLATYTGFHFVKKKQDAQVTG